MRARPWYAEQSRHLCFMQVRLYRVRWFFEHLEFNLTMSLLWVTLIRNLIVRLLLFVFEYYSVNVT